MTFQGFVVEVSIRHCAASTCCAQHFRQSLLPLSLQPIYPRQCADYGLLCAALSAVSTTTPTLITTPAPVVMIPAPITVCSTRARVNTQVDIRKCIASQNCSPFDFQSTTCDHDHARPYTAHMRTYTCVRARTRTHTERENCGEREKEHTRARTRKRKKSSCKSLLDDDFAVLTAAPPPVMISCTHAHAHAHTCTQSMCKRTHTRAYAQRTHRTLEILKKERYPRQLSDFLPEDQSAAWPVCVIVGTPCRESCANMQIQYRPDDQSAAGSNTHTSTHRIGAFFSVGKSMHY